MDLGLSFSVEPSCHSIITYLKSDFFPTYLKHNFNHLLMPSIFCLEVKQITFNHNSRAKTHDLMKPDVNRVGRYNLLQGGAATIHKQ